MPPRQLVAKDESHFSDGARSTPPEKPSKRKAVSSACVPCRRRKSKCDGGLPACSTCIAVYRTECTYDGETEQRKKPIPRKNILPLQIRQASSSSSSSSSPSSSTDVIVNSLRTLSEDEAVTLLQHIRSQESLDDLAQSIAGRASVGQDSARLPLGPTVTSPIRPSSTNLQRDVLSSPASASPKPSSERMWNDTTSQLSRSRQSPDSWFRTPQDNDFVANLLHLYFSWHHPFHTVFSGPHFMHDYQKGVTKYCSSMLIYAILSLGCQYVDKDDETVDVARHIAMGDLYFHEADTLLNAVQESSLTTVQASAVMALREASCGREKNCYRYLGRSVRMAMELNLHLSVEGNGNGLQQLDIETAKVTFWALQNMETMNAMIMGRVSHIPPPSINVEKPSNADKLDSIIYQPYEGVNQAVEPAVHHAMHCLLFTTKSGELCQIINDSNLALYAPQEHFNPQRLQSAHARYQSWYQNLPEMFLIHNTELPQDVTLHMSFFKAQLHLFLPFFNVDLSQAGLRPRDICIYSARAISSLVDQLRSLCGISRLCVSVIGAIYSAASVHLINLPDPSATLNLCQAFNDLRTLSANHALASRCIDRLRALAARWNISLPEASGVVPLMPEELLHNDAVLGVLHIRASLSDELKGRPLGAAGVSGSFRDRYDSASTMATHPSYQEHGHICQTGTAGPSQMLWGQYQPSQVLPQEMQTQSQTRVMHEEASQIYAPYRPAR